MTARTTSSFASALADGKPHIEWHRPVLTTEDRLLRIRALGERVAGHVQYFDGVATLLGSSDEAKERAVALFFECLIRFERALGRIKDDLQLG